jgi:hypothetical protein
MVLMVRARGRACLLALLIVMVLTPSQARAQAAPSARPSILAAARAVPDAFRFDGSGYGHGIGMSQYGAYGMALRGYSSTGIIAHYYRGAAAGPARLPETISVGMLQAALDPLTRGRLGQVLVRGASLPGAGGSGTIVVSGYGPGGETWRRYLPGGVVYSIRPEAGGMSVFGPGGRVFGRPPWKAAAGWCCATGWAAACGCPRCSSSPRGGARCAGVGSRYAPSATTGVRCGRGRC